MTEINKKTYSYLLFDLDGTIADSSKGIFNGLRYMAAELGLSELPEPVMRRFLGPPLLSSLETEYGITGDKALEGINAYREYYSVTGLMECAPYPGICTTIKELGISPTKLFVATSKPTPFAEKIIDSFGLTDCFTAVVGSNLDNTRTKKAEVVSFILDTYDLAKHECLMIGDRDSDIIGANKCGVDSLGITYGYGSIEELKSAGATFIAERPEDILSYAGVGSESFL